MSEIIIKDSSTGQSFRYQPTKAGYAQAEAQVKAITQQGHSVSGDLGRIAYQQSGGRSTSFPW